MCWARQDAIFSLSGWARVFGYTLGREVSVEEASEFIGEVNAAHRKEHPEDYTEGGLQNIERAETSFWKSKL